MRLLISSLILITSVCAVDVRAQAWKQIGPRPIDGDGFTNAPGATVAGMVQDIAIDPSGTSDSTIYIASTAGGVWKSTDGGSSWSDKSSSMGVLYIGAIKLDPKNPHIVYAGVGGEWCCNVGGGLYRSDDSADSWKTLNPNGIFTGLSIGAIALPDSGTILLGTNGGLFKSVDSGEHFGDNAPKFDNGNAIAIATPQGSVSNGNISDLQLDTADTKTVYAAIDGDGVYKSTDSGSTFPASGKLFSKASFPNTISGDVWIKFAQSTRPNNKTMYAFLCMGNNSQACALLKSKDTGGSFSEVPIGNLSINQGDYDQVVAIDPQDANGVYIALRQVYYVNDGAVNGFNLKNNQIDVNGAHTDDHVIAFSPPSHYTGGAPTRIWVGNDGGITTTAVNRTPPGQTWTSLNAGISTNLFYAIDIGRGGHGDNGYTYGGLQDNGSISGVPSGSGTKWQFQCCGDSGSVSVDPKNPLHVVTLNDSGYTCTTNGTAWYDCGNFPNGTALGLVGFDPNGGLVYATSGKRFYQSKDNGNTFTVMDTFAQSINSMAIAKGDANRIWLGMNDGTLRTTGEALKGAPAKWTNVSIPGAPSNQSVNGVAIDPTDSATVVVVYPGFSDSTDPPQHAYMTTDKGEHWKNISGVAGGGDSNLPDLPLNAVVILPTTTPHTIIVGSDAGVLQTADTGKTWQVLGTGFPPVQVTSLALDYAASPFVLRAATWGRSIFELQGSCPLCPPQPECKLAGCDSTTNWSFNISCTGMNVGVVYNGQCHDASGENTSCYAGFKGGDSVTAAWSGEIGAPTFLTDGAQGSPRACTTNNANQENCKTFTFSNLPACAAGVTEPPAACPTGQRLCAKFAPPRCVPDSECLLIKNTP